MRGFCGSSFVSSSFPLVCVWGEEVQRVGACKRVRGRVHDRGGGRETERVGERQNGRVCKRLRGTGGETTTCSACARKCAREREPEGARMCVREREKNERERGKGCGRPG